jgi:carboxylesterase
MKKQKQTKKNGAFLIARNIIIVLLLTVGLVALVIWVLWPVRQGSFQTAQVQHYSFESAKAKVGQINQTEQVANIKPECYSKLYLHEQPVARSVVMFHGVSACPLQFSGLAQYFYDHGYNVYVPLAPEHGRTDNLNHAKVTTQGLVDYVNTSINVTAALGNEMGVVGLSGGGNLSTWAAQYRPEVRRMLTLSPFYEPSNSQSPKWQIRPLLVFHGNNFLLPDQLNKPKDPQHALSYRALAKYVTIFNNLPEPPRDTGLQHMAVVMAEDDDLIDQPLALKTLGNIANANHTVMHRYQVPASYKLGHDIISPDNEYVVQHQAFLHQKYFELYEQ